MSTCVHINQYVLVRKDKLNRERRLQLCDRQTSSTLVISARYVHVNHRNISYVNEYEGYNEDRQSWMCSVVTGKSKRTLTIE